MTEAIGKSAAPSPYGPPLRFAWWGRVSTEDQQDPTLSLPRQLHGCRAALPPGAAIVAHFYDVESGRRDLEKRGRGSAHERFDIPIPRDGGIQELLEQAQSPERAFDAVICESIERVARRTYYGTKIEHDLEAAGVALFAADEPILANGKRATTILTRRVKQGVAEWYVLELLEKSWDGFCEHTRQGWNVGQPPESTDPARRKGRWSPATLHGILNNPKYTGYMVWNRRATKKGGRTNPRDAWVWSEEPTHEAIVTREMFDAAAAVASERERSRGGGGAANDKHPQTKRSYVLRSFVHCQQCGCRMFGKANKFGTRYYVCQPKLNLGSDYKKRLPDHPPTVWIREQFLLEGIATFLNERVFGPDRIEIVQAALAAIDGEPERDHRERMHAIRRALKQLEARQARLIQSLERDDDPEGVVFRRVRDRLTELERERTSKMEQLQKLEAESFSRRPGNPALLDALPVGEVNLLEAPDGLVRNLLEALRLEVRYDKGTHRARYRVVVRGDSVETVRRGVGDLINLDDVRAAKTAENAATSAESAP